MGSPTFVAGAGMHQNMPVLSSVEQLSVCEPHRTILSWRSDMSSLEWLRPFLPFIAVRDLSVSEQVVLFATAAPQRAHGGKVHASVTSPEQGFLGFNHLGMCRKRSNLLFHPINFLVTPWLLTLGGDHRRNQPIIDHPLRSQELINVHTGASSSLRCMISRTL